MDSYCNCPFWLTDEDDDDDKEDMLSVVNPSQAMMMSTEVLWCSFVSLVFLSCQHSKSYKV